MSETSIVRDRLTAIDQLRLHVECELAVPDHSELLDEIDALSARLSAAEAPRQLKELGWEMIESCSGPDYWRAKTPVGEYEAGWEDGAWAQCDGPSMWEWSSGEDHRLLTVDAAKAAAQADYERRLSSCYEATPEDAIAKARSDAINEFSAKLGLKVTDEVKGLPDDVRLFRAQAAIRAEEGE